MIRVLLEYLIPLLLPIAIYLVWTWITGKQRRTAEEPPRWYEGPWFWLLVAGFVLMVAVMAVTAVIEGSSPDRVYVPPHVEDGRIVPGHFKEKG